MIDTVSEKFIRSYNEIERHFRNELNINEHKGFLTLLQEYNKTIGMSKDCRVDLKEFAELRNAIVHNINNNTIIATPLESTVKRIHDIEETLKRPPLVKDLYYKKVYTVDVEEKVGRALNILKKFEISQLPVVKNGVIVEILNSSTITYWLANKEIVDTEEKVGEVIRYREVNKNFEVINPKLNAYQAAKIFVKSYRRNNNGWFLDAVIITDNGSPGGIIKGIIVLEDIANYIEMG